MINSCQILFKGGVYTILLAIRDPVAQHPF